MSSVLLGWSRSLHHPAEVEVSYRIHNSSTLAHVLTKKNAIVRESVQHLVTCYFFTLVIIPGEPQTEGAPCHNQMNLTVP